MSSILKNDNYIILANPVKTEAWSVSEIPFEPKGWKKDMRSDIRKALTDMYAPEGRMYAQYVSSAEKFCDVENVLLYNIGPGAFKNICNYAFCIERGYYTAKPYDINENKLSHYYKYEAVNEANFEIYNIKKVLSEWKGVVCPFIKHTPLFFWQYIKNSVVDVWEKDYEDKFGMEIVINAPNKISLTSIIKPILDGVICAHHQHIGILDDQILSILSTETGLATFDCGKLIYDKNSNVLGKRKIVQGYRGGIKWNPADDLCVAIKLILNVRPGDWKIDGKIFSVDTTV